MVEFEEPPLIPKRLRAAAEQDKQLPLNMEAELIRLKNEPYKRRRSRKSFEKVDILAPGALRRQAPHVCVVCYEIFPDTAKLRLHMKHHHDEMMTFKCAFCPFLGESKSDLVKHVKMLHEAGSPRSLSFAGSPTFSDLDSSRSNDTSSASDLPGKVAQQVADSDLAVNAIQNSVETCSPHDVKEEENSDHLIKEEQPNENTQETDTTEKEEILDVVNIKKEDCEDKPDTKVSQNAKCATDSPSGENNSAKAEDPETPKSETVDTRNLSDDGVIEESPKENEAPKPVVGVSKSASVSRPATPLTPLNGQVDGKVDTECDGNPLGQKLEKCTAKYCKQCDISFMYLSSFVAHKKHYCNSHVNNEKQVALAKV